MRSNLLKTWRSSGAPLRLRELRKARGLKLADLALRAGVSKGTLSKLENAAHRPNPSLDLVEAIAVALGVSREELFRDAASAGQNSRGRNRPSERSLELYLRELKPSSANARRFLRVATHDTPPRTVPEWRLFTEWLALFTGRDPRPAHTRTELSDRVRSFSRP